MRCIDLQRRSLIGSASQSLLHDPDAPSARNEVSISLSTLAPSLRAATSSMRFPDDKTSDRTRWQPVDYEILHLLQDHLHALSSGPGGEGSGFGDAWTVGQAVCNVLKALVPAVRNLK